MDKIKLLFATVLFVTICGCSSNEDEGANAETPSKFVMYLNGEERYNGNAIAFKKEDQITINIGSGIYLHFDKDGRLGYLSCDVYNTQGNPNNFMSFKNFNSHYFEFNLEPIDLQHKRVRGTFAGFIYDNPENLNSESKYVNGNFDVHYDELVPAVFGMKHEAKINGVPWASTRKIQDYDYPQQQYQSYLVREELSDDPYKITMYYRSFIEVGTYAFTESDVSNKIHIAKFNPDTASYIHYNSTGTINITNREGWANEIITGNYSLTGVNPNDASDVVQVTDGNLKISKKVY